MFCTAYALHRDDINTKEKLNELGKDIYIYNSHSSLNKPKEMILYEEEKTLHAVLTEWGYKKALVGWGALKNWVIIKHPKRYNYNPYPPLYIPKEMILYEEEKNFACGSHSVGK